MTVVHKNIQSRQPSLPFVPSFSCVLFPSNSLLFVVATGSPVVSWHTPKGTLRLAPARQTGRAALGQPPITPASQQGSTGPPLFCPRQQLPAAGPVSPLAYSPVPVAAQNSSRHGMSNSRVSDTAALAQALAGVR